MKEDHLMKISVTIPEFERRFKIAEKTRRTGKPKYWTVNGQALYNATLHFRARAKITEYYHKYLSKYIKEQISNIQIQQIRHNVGKDLPHKLSISLDIYEVKKGMLPDVGNLWIWLKWFEDALQDCGVIIDDNPDFVIESGRKKYHWVETDEQRKLVFKIEIV